MPMPKRPLTDHEQDALSTLAEHMGNPMDENSIDIGHHIERLVHEKNYAKMRAAQTGGASEDLGPSDIETQQVKQRGATRQQAATQGAQQAMQAQGQETPVNAPPAPAGPQGATQPYPAQAGPQPPPNVQSPGQGAQGAPAAPGAPQGQDEDEQNGEVQHFQEGGPVLSKKGQAGGKVYTNLDQPMTDDEYRRQYEAGVMEPGAYMLAPNSAELQRRAQGKDFNIIRDAIPPKTDPGTQEYFKNSLLYDPLPPDKPYLSEAEANLMEQKQKELDQQQHPSTLRPYSDPNMVINPNATPTPAPTPEPPPPPQKDRPNFLGAIN